MINNFLSQTEDNIQLILGDFNYNALVKDANIDKLLEVLINYQQVFDIVAL